MELRQLRNFLRVAEEGSINRAAGVLHMSQPSLSHSIKTLEQSLGVLLFTRGGAGVTLTKHGETFRGYAGHIVRQAEKAKDEMGLQSGKGSAKLSIGVVNAFSHTLFSRLLARFMEQHPKSIVKSYSFGARDSAVESLGSSHWDVALTLLREDTDLGPDIEIVNLARSESSVYCGVSHRLANVADVSIDELAQSEWAVTTGSVGERILTDCFSERGLVPNIRYRANSINQMISLIQSAPLLCMAPAITVVDDVSQGRVVRVSQDHLRSSAWFALLYSNLSIRTPALRDFLRICEAEVGPRLSVDHDLRRAEQA